MIIAEFCGNHLGSRDRLKEMVQVAAQAGANFAKIQSFFADDLAPEWDHDYTRTKSLEIDWPTHSLFVKWCEESGITPMTTVYTLDYADKLWASGFKWVKIGSPQAMDEALISGYVHLGFQVIVSTGGHKLAELPRIHPLAGVLHCVSKYPLRAYEANLLRMLELKKYFIAASIGFSSHIDPLDPECLNVLWAASFLGASFIEVHFTLLPRNETKDGHVSLDTQQLAKLCEYDRLSFEQKLSSAPKWGALSFPQCQEEMDLIKRYAGRWKR